MTTIWLILTLALVAVGWLATWSYRDTMFRAATVAAIPIVSAIAWRVLLVPLGNPSSDIEPGEYAVLGARIDVERAIYVLIDAQPSPRYYILPYSTKTAEELQSAMDSQRGVRMDAQDGEEPVFGEMPVEAPEPKRPENPAMRLEGPGL